MEFSSGVSVSTLDTDARIRYDWKTRDVMYEYQPEIKNASFRSTPHPVTVTTRIITFLIGNPYKPSFVTVTGWGVDLMYEYQPKIKNASCFIIRNLRKQNEPYNPYLDDHPT